MYTSQQTSRGSSIATYDEKDLEKGTPGRNSEGSDISAASTHDGIQTPDTKESPLQQSSERTAALEWDGPEDSDNPLNWSQNRKIFYTFIPTGIATVCTISSSIYTPGREGVARDFGVSDEVSLLPFSLYLLGLAFGPMLAAPTSENFGRRAVYLGGMPLFALFTLGAGFSNNIVALTICRFLAGLCGSPGLSIGAATISDMWPPAERLIPMACFVTAPFLGPSIGPLLGGYVVVGENWRWTQWAVLFFTVVCLSPLIAMKETYKLVILRRRAEARGVVIAAGPKTSTLHVAKQYVTTQLTRPMHMACVEPVVGCFALYQGLNFGMLYSFFAAFPYVFSETYAFGIVQTGLTFIGLGVGCIAGMILMIIFARTFFPKLVARSIQAGDGGRIPPEKRLCFAMIGSPCLPISLFWFGWSTQAGVHWICPVIAEAVFGFGNLLLFMSATMYIMDFYGPRFGASAMGANNMARYVTGAAFPLFITQMYKALGIAWATSLLGFISLALVPIPYALYIYGPRLRKSTKYAK